MDATLEQELASEAPFVFLAVVMELPDYTLRLLDGSAQITIDGELFVGEDEIFGTLDSLDTLSEAIEEEAPEILITLLPPDEAAAADLASSAMQGSTVRVLLGCFNPVTGGVVGVPEELFLGEVDVPTVETSQGALSVSFKCVSVFERFFEMKEGERASDGWHQSIHPGEKGLEYVTSTVRTLYWGGKLPVVSPTTFLGRPVTDWSGQ